MVNGSGCRVSTVGAACSDPKCVDPRCVVEPGRWRNRCAVGETVSRSARPTVGFRERLRSVAMSVIVAGRTFAFVDHPWGRGPSESVGE